MHNRFCDKAGATNGGAGYPCTAPRVLVGAGDQAVQTNHAKVTDGCATGSALVDHMNIHSCSALVDHVFSLLCIRVVSVQSLLLNTCIHSCPCLLIKGGAFTEDGTAWTW